MREQDPTGDIEKAMPHAATKTAGTIPDGDGQPVIGFVGIGVMGEPMALNLLRSGVSLVAWNRTPGRTGALAAAGARVANSAAQVFGEAQTIIMMLVTGAVMDQVLGRGTAEFAERVRGRTIINMATTSPDYSARLARDLREAGSRYVEAPVSGQRPIAEAGKLVAMAAGDPGLVAEVRPLLQPMCHRVVDCGRVPNGLSMKLAVNLVAGTMMTIMAEGVNYARSQGLDIDLFASVLGASSLASDFMRMKLPKLVSHDFAVQGAIRIGLKDLDMMREAAHKAGAAIPVLETCSALWEETLALGLGDRDVASVVRAIEERSQMSKYHQTGDTGSVPVAW